MLVLNVQKMSTEDGPGLRTTVFFKGCPLACKWCHNPESIGLKKEIEWLFTRCIGCKICLSSCAKQALSDNGHGIVINRDICVACGNCVENCPTGALEVKGKKMDINEIFHEVIKDKAYYGEKGGVTLSGGEVMIQADEAAKLLKLFKNEGVHTAVDTSGFCQKSAFDKVIPYVDLFLYDLKIFDCDLHKKFVGAENKLILDNFNYLCEKKIQYGFDIWVRTPIIPDSTDSDDNIRKISNFINNRVEKYELCAFNNLCLDKYERLYKQWHYKNAELIFKEKMEHLKNVAINAGTQNVIWSGSTKLSKE